MPLTKTCVLLLVNLLFTAFVAGCAGRSPHTNAENPIVLENFRPGFDVVYLPMPRPGQTLDSVKNDIASNVIHLDLDPDDFPPYPLKALNSIRGGPQNSDSVVRWAAAHTDEGGTIP